MLLYRFPYYHGDILIYNADIICNNITIQVMPILISWYDAESDIFHKYVSDENSPKSRWYIDFEIRNWFHDVSYHNDMIRGRYHGDKEWYHGDTSISRYDTDVWFDNADIMIWHCHGKFIPCYFRYSNTTLDMIHQYHDIRQISRWNYRYHNDKTAINRDRYHTNNSHRLLWYTKQISRWYEIDITMMLPFFDIMKVPAIVIIQLWYFTNFTMIVSRFSDSAKREVYL